MDYFAFWGSESMEYITIKEAAEKWNLSVRRVQTICNEGMIQPGFSDLRDEVPINAWNKPFLVMFMKYSIVTRIYTEILINQAVDNFTSSRFRESRIQGTIKFGHAWAIPKDAEKPADKRIKTKKYMKR